MPRPKKQELEDSRTAFNNLKPLPPYYGVRVGEMFPHIDVPKLQQAVAGRLEYPEGLEALKVICLLYSRQRAQPVVA